MVLSFLKSLPEIPYSDRIQFLPCDFNVVEKIGL